MEDLGLRIKGSGFGVTGLDLLITGSLLQKPVIPRRFFYSRVGMKFFLCCSRNYSRQVLGRCAGC